MSKRLSRPKSKVKNTAPIMGFRPEPLLRAKILALADFRAAFYSDLLRDAIRPVIEKAESDGEISSDKVAEYLAEIGQGSTPTDSPIDEARAQTLASVRAKVLKRSRPAAGPSGGK